MRRRCKCNLSVAKNHLRLPLFLSMSDLDSLLEELELDSPTITPAAVRGQVGPLCPILQRPQACGVGRPAPALRNAQLSDGLVPMVPRQNDLEKPKPSDETILRSRVRRVHCLAMTRWRVQTLPSLP